MASRYSTVKEFTPIINEKTGQVKRFLHNRRFFSKEDVGETFIIHSVKQNEMLDMIAYIYYGDETYAWLIADINDIEYPMEIKVGADLIIPTLDIIEGKRI